MIGPNDEIPDHLSNEGASFAIWSSFQLVSRTQRKEITNKIVNEQYDKLDAPVSIDGITETYRAICDEGMITDEEISEIIEKRFSKALPMDCINVITLFEMH